MPDLTPATLPDDLEALVRVTPVPLEVRTLLRPLGPFALRVLLPRDRRPLPLALRQLLKLALVVDDSVELTAVAFSEASGPLSATVSLAGEAPPVTLTEDELGGDLRTLVHRLLVELAPGQALVRAAETFALEIARGETVRTLAGRMLQATELDEALYAMLLGVTSGYGARLHRAALFEWAPASETFGGSIAIGPRDEAEAHRIWEAMEAEDTTLEETLRDHGARDRAAGFEGYVRSLRLRATPGDELTVALSSREPVVFRRRPANPTLARLLEPATEFVLALIQPRGARLGLLVADNAFGGLPIEPGQVEFLRAFVEPTSLVWDTRSLLRRVEDLARHDGLTGLFNRRELDERLAAEESRCTRAERPLSVAMIDFDHFKDINDARGHAAGDAMLRRVGALLRETLRQHDVASRYGGDEFALVLPDASKDDLVAVMTRVGRRALAEGISLSIGGATWPDDRGDGETLLTAADAQLYAAKAAGRACLAVARSGPVRF